MSRDIRKHLCYCTDCGRELARRLKGRVPQVCVVSKAGQKKISPVAKMTAKCHVCGADDPTCSVLHGSTYEHKIIDLLLKTPVYRGHVCYCQLCACKEFGKVLAKKKKLKCPVCQRVVDRIVVKDDADDERVPTLRRCKSALIIREKLEEEISGVYRAVVSIQRESSSQTVDEAKRDLQKDLALSRYEETMSAIKKLQEGTFFVRKEVQIQQKPPSQRIAEGRQATQRSLTLRRYLEALSAFKRLVNAISDYCEAEVQLQQGSLSQTSVGGNRDRLIDLATRTCNERRPARRNRESLSQTSAGGSRSRLIDLATRTSNERRPARRNRESLSQTSAGGSRDRVIDLATRTSNERRPARRNRESLSQTSAGGSRDRVIDLATRTSNERRPARRNRESLSQTSAGGSRSRLIDLATRTSNERRPARRNRESLSQTSAGGSRSRLIDLATRTSNERRPARRNRESLSQTSAGGSRDRVIDLATRTGLAIRTFNVRRPARGNRHGRTSDFQASEFLRWQDPEQNDIRPSFGVKLRKDHAVHGAYVRITSIDQVRGGEVVGDIEQDPVAEGSQNMQTYSVMGLCEEAMSALEEVAKKLLGNCDAETPGHQESKGQTVVKGTQHRRREDSTDRTREKTEAAFGKLHEAVLASTAVETSVQQEPSDQTAVDETSMLYRFESAKFSWDKQCPFCQMTPDVSQGSKCVSSSLTNFFATRLYYNRHVCYWIESSKKIVRKWKGRESRVCPFPFCRKQVDRLIMNAAPWKARTVKEEIKECLPCKVKKEADKAAKQSQKTKGSSSTAKKAVCKADDNTLKTGGSTTKTKEEASKSADRMQKTKAPTTKKKGETSKAANSAQKTKTSAPKAKEEDSKSGDRSKKSKDTSSKATDPDPETPIPTCSAVHGDT